MQEGRQHPYNMTLRVPVEYRQWLHDQANLNRRSVNAEMLICLDEVRRMREVARHEDHAR